MHFKLNNQGQIFRAQMHFCTYHDGGNRYVYIGVQCITDVHSTVANCFIFFRAAFKDPLKKLGAPEFEVPLTAAAISLTN